MTQFANTGDSAWHPPNTTVPFGVGAVCAACGTWYQGYHECGNSVPFSPEIKWYQSQPWSPPPSDLLKEFKKFYRQVLFNEIVQMAEYELDQLDIDEEVRKKVMEMIEGFEYSIVHSGTNLD